MIRQREGHDALLTGTHVEPCPEISAQSHHKVLQHVPGSVTSSLAWRGRATLDSSTNIGLRVGNSQASTWTGQLYF